MAVWAGARQVAAAVALVAATAGAAAPQGRGMIYTAYCVPDPIDYGGHIFVYLRNPTEAPLTVSEITLDGQSIGTIWPTDATFLDPPVREQYIRIADDRLEWYRVYPNPVPPGQVAEVILRLTPAAMEPEEHQVAVRFAGAQEPLLRTVVSADPGFALEYVGIGPDLDELHLYARTGTNAGVKISRVEVDGARVDATIDASYLGVTHAQVRLVSPWRYGSFHAMAMGSESDLRAVLIRALPTPPPLGIMGNNSEREVALYRDNLFEVNLAFTAVPAERYAPLAQYGLRGAYIYGTRLKPAEEKTEPVYYNDIAQVSPIRGLSALWAYFLEDEPDGRYHRTDLPRGSITRDVERANQFCRIFDPGTPTYLQIDHGGYPRGLYTYGQIPDYLCTHAYGIGRGNLLEATTDHVTHTQAASRPRCFYYLNEGYCHNDQREFEPDELRMEAYAALAAGAKSLQWYPAHGDRGLLQHPAMWNAVGAISGVLHQVLPLLSIGVPVGEPSVQGGNYLSSLILCGDQALAVILVNRNFRSTAEQFVRAAAPEATVRVSLPAAMQASHVVALRFPDEPVEVPFEVDGATVTFSAAADPVEMLVICADESVLAGLRDRHAEVLERYRPMPMPEP